MVQVLPVGPTRLAVSWAPPVQNVQAAIHLFRARLHHDQGVTLPYRFGVRMHLAIWDPEGEEPVSEALLTIQRAASLEAEVLRRWDGRMGGGQGNAWAGKTLLYEVMHDPFRLGQ
jgi:hypothetical protein